MKFKDVTVYLLNIAEICGRTESAFDIYQVVTFSWLLVGWCDTGILQSFFHGFHFCQHLDDAVKSINFFSNLDSPSPQCLHASTCSFPSLDCAPMPDWPEVQTASAVSHASLAPLVVDQALVLGLRVHWIWAWWGVQWCIMLTDFQGSLFPVHNRGALGPRSSGGSPRQMFGNGGVPGLG